MDHKFASEDGSSDDHKLHDESAPNKRLEPRTGSLADKTLESLGRDRLVANVFQTQTPEPRVELFQPKLAKQPPAEVEDCCLNIILGAAAINHRGDVGVRGLERFYGGPHRRVRLLQWRLAVARRADRSLSDLGLIRCRRC